MDRKKRKRRQNDDNKSDVKIATMITPPRTSTTVSRLRQNTTDLMIGVRLRLFWSIANLLGDAFVREYFSFLPYSIQGVIRFSIGTYIWQAIINAASMGYILYSSRVGFRFSDLAVFIRSTSQFVTNMNNVAGQTLAQRFMSERKNMVRLARLVNNNRDRISVQTVITPFLDWFRTGEEDGSGRVVDDDLFVDDDDLFVDDDDLFDEVDSTEYLEELDGDPEIFRDQDLIDSEDVIDNESSGLVPFTGRRTTSTNDNMLEVLATFLEDPLTIEEVGEQVNTLISRGAIAYQYETTSDYNPAVSARRNALAIQSRLNNQLELIRQEMDNGVLEQIESAGIIVDPRVSLQFASEYSMNTCFRLLDHTRQFMDGLKDEAGIEMFSNSDYTRMAEKCQLNAWDEASDAKAKFSKYDERLYKAAHNYGTGGFTNFDSRFLTSRGSFEPMKCAPEYFIWNLNSRVNDEDHEEYKTEVSLVCNEFAAITAITMLLLFKYTYKGVRWLKRKAMDNTPSPLDFEVLEDDDDDDDDTDSIPVWDTGRRVSL